MRRKVVSFEGMRTDCATVCFVFATGAELRCGQTLRTIARFRRLYMLVSVADTMCNAWWLVRAAVRSSSIDTSASDMVVHEPTCKDAEKNIKNKKAGETSHNATKNEKTARERATAPLPWIICSLALPKEKVDRQPLLLYRRKRTEH